MQLIDLSQEIFTGMPVFDGHPQVSITPAVTHEERGENRKPNDGVPGSQ